MPVTAVSLAPERPAGRGQAAEDEGGLPGFTRLGTSRWLTPHARAAGSVISGTAGWPSPRSRVTAPAPAFSPQPVPVAPPRAQALPSPMGVCAAQPEE